MKNPLETIVMNCNHILNSPQLKTLEQSGHQSAEIMQFRKEINASKNLSSMLVFQLKDLQDWHQIRQGSFKKVNSKFNLRDCLREISEMMSLKAENKNIEFELK